MTEQKRGKSFWEKLADRLNELLDTLARPSPEPVPVPVEIDPRRPRRR